MSGFGSPAAPTNAPINYTGLNVGSSQWNAPVAIFWGMRRVSNNAIGFGNFQSHSTSAKGKGGGGKADQQQTYSANVALGLGEGIVDSIQNIWANGSTTTTTTLSALNMSFFSGTISQSPWTGISGQNLAYSQLAYLGATDLNLGESSTIPDLSFECVRANGFAYTYDQSAGGWINPSSHTQCPALDCLMSDIITDLLTNVQYGMGFASGDIGPLTQFATYQRAQGLFFSPLLVSQEKCTEIIDRWAQLSNSWIYWSGTQLNFVPLGDSAVTGNGVTYTPVQDVAYNLTPNDFLMSDGKDGGVVKPTRLDPAAASNRTALDFTDRTLGYIDNPVEWKDDGLVDQYKLRDNSSIQADEICDPGVARIAVQLIGKRKAYIRNGYAFNTSYKYILCLPGTILTLTDPTIPIGNIRVRVQTVARSGKDKSGKGVLAFVCEEFPGTVGTYYPPVAASAPVPPATPIFNISPGFVL